MNITLICHYFAPEPGAPSARLFEMSREWVRHGHTVKVVTCFPNHPTGVVPPQYRGRLRAVEDLSGIKVYRNWTYVTRNEGVLKKTIGHLSFMVSSVLLSLFRTGPTDVVVVSSPTFFSMFSGYLFSRFKRAPLVLEIRDLWPAAIIELGVLRNRILIRVLEALELWAYRTANHIVVVTEAFKENLVSRGIAAEKIAVITNGVDLERYSQGLKSEAVEAALDCRGKSLVLYIGALGMSQGLESIIRAAERLKGRENVVFALVGEGAEQAKLQRLAAELGLAGVRFLPAQPKERMPDFYHTADICLVPLRNVALFEGFIPSKMFEIMACGRPIIASLAGEAARILDRSGGAVIVPPEDSAAIAQAVLELIEDKPVRDRLGAAGATYVAQFYDRAKLALEYERVLALTGRGTGKHAADRGGGP